MAMGALLGTVSASFFEWVLHRYLMHRSWRIFRYPFERHTLTHHRVFKADSSYHLLDVADMVEWAGVDCSQPAPTARGVMVDRAMGVGCRHHVGACVYYAAYEYMHWCMHVPRKRNVERSGIFFRLNGHHLLHHRYMNKNFNVVFPLADMLLGTLLLRSKVQFAQARGPSLARRATQDICLQPARLKQIDRPLQLAIGIVEVR